MERLPELSFSTSATARAAREGEVDGVDYHFLSPSRFDELLESGAFLEHATVYDRSYGTLRSVVDDALVEGRSLVLDIDVQGAAQVRQVLEEAVHVFIAPPSLRELERRLRGRGTDSEETIAIRMQQAAGQLAGLPTYDYVVINDDLTRARATFEAIVRAELARCARNGPLIDSILGEIASTA